MYATTYTFTTAFREVLETFCIKPRVYAFMPSNHQLHTFTSTMSLLTGIFAADAFLVAQVGHPSAAVPAPADGVEVELEAVNLRAYTIIVVELYRVGRKGRKPERSRN